MKQSINETFNQLISLANYMYGNGRDSNWIQEILHDLVNQAFNILKTNVEKSGHQIDDVSKAYESGDMNKYLEIMKDFDKVIEDYIKNNN